MLSPTQHRAILLKSLAVNLARLALAQEMMATGEPPRTPLARLRRSLRSVRTDAEAAGIDPAAVQWLRDTERAAQAAHEAAAVTGPERDLFRAATGELVRLQAIVEAGKEYVPPDALVAQAATAGRNARRRLRKDGLRPGPA